MNANAIRKSITPILASMRRRKSPVAMTGGRASLWARFVIPTAIWTSIPIKTAAQFMRSVLLAMGGMGGFRKLN
jgi:hypothetical protein